MAKAKPPGSIVDDLKGNVKSRFAKFQPERQPFIDRGVTMAQLTLPSVFLREGIAAGTTIPDPNQSIGARGVNNLSSKLLMTLLPPNVSFFRYELSTKVQNQIAKTAAAQAQQNPDPTAPNLKDEMDIALSNYEGEILKEVEAVQIRPALFMALKHLIITGNVLLHIPNKDTARYYDLKSYTMRRDPRGNMIELYVHEKVSPLTLPVAIQDTVIGLLTDGKPPEECITLNLVADIYTAVVRGPKNYAVWQEVMGVVVPGSEGTYPLDDCQWVPLRFSRIDGEHYGRGLVEDYAGDLNTADALAEAIAQSALAAAKVVFMVRPNSSTDVKDLENAPNLGFVQGNKEDVEALQINKQADLQVTNNYINELRTTLSYAFLLNSAVQRDAERVTAEEIRFMAQELEDTIGGVYSLLSAEFQRPLVTRLTNRLIKAGTLPALPASTVTPIIVTGLDALGRSHELDNLAQALEMITQLLGPQAIPQYMNASTIITKVFTAKGINPKDLVKSAAQQQQDAAAAQHAALSQQVAPEVVRQGGQMLQNMQQHAQSQAPTPQPQTGS